MTTRMPGNHNPNSVKDRVKGEIRDRVKGQPVIEHRVELVIEVEQRVKLVIEVGQVERIEVSGTSEGSFRDECTCASFSRRGSPPVASVGSSNNPSIGHA